MKKLLMTVSMSIGFLVLCIGTFMGFRFWPTMGRVLVASFSAYVGGLLLAVILAVTYLSNDRTNENENPEVAKTPAKEEKTHESL